MGFAVGLSSGVIGLCVGRVLYMEFFHVNIEPAIYYKLGFFLKIIYKSLYVMNRILSF